MTRLDRAALVELARRGALIRLGQIVRELEILEAEHRRLQSVLGGHVIAQGLAAVRDARAGLEAGLALSQARQKRHVPPAERARRAARMRRLVRRLWRDERAIMLKFARTGGRPRKAEP